LKSLSDYQFILEAFLENQKSFFYIDKPIVNYRLGGVSAQILLFESLQEGFLARKNAGISLFKNTFSVLIRLSVSLVYKLRRAF
jgi:hypothetical protein